MLKYISLLFLMFTTYSFSQEWTSIAPVPSAGRDDGVAFSLNNKGFVVTGTADGSNYSESNKLFCYHPENNSWSEKAEFPGIKRQYSSVFTIDGKAYLVGGYSEFGTPLNDVWEYNESLDIWIQRNNFPGNGRWDATTFSMNGIGYFGLGTTQIGTLADIWKYSPENDDWNLLTYYSGSSGGGLRSVVALPLFDKIFLGEGFSVHPNSPISYYEEWYSYEPATDILRGTYDSPIGFRSYGTALSNGVFALVCGGMNKTGEFKNDCYRLDYSGKWTQLNSIGTEGLRGSSGFVIGGDFYLGTGLKADGTKTNEFYKLTSPANPLSETFVFPNPSNADFNIISNPESEVSIYSVDGKLLLKTRTDVSGYLRINELTSGLFIVKVLSNDQEISLVIEKI